MTSPPSAPAGGEEAKKVEKVEVRTASPKGVSVSLPPFTTNRADPLGQRFIRVNLVIEVADAKASEELTQQDARVRDSILLLLSSKSYADIASPESKLLLKSEIGVLEYRVYAGSANTTADDVYAIRDLIRTAIRRCAEAKQEQPRPGRFIIARESGEREGL